MKQSNNSMQDLTLQLQDLTQIKMPENIFPEIQMGLHKKNFVRRHRLISSLSIAAVMAMTLLFFTQNNRIDEKDLLIQELVKRTMQLEQLFIAETPTSTIPGSQITERIVNMETWLVKLDKDIKQTKDKRKLSELMAAKLNILGDLVMLQRKINQKPDFQRVKPFII